METGPNALPRQSCSIHYPFSWSHYTKDFKNLQISSKSVLSFILEPQLTDSLLCSAELEIPSAQFLPKALIILA